MRVVIKSIKPISLAILMMLPLGAISLVASLVRDSSVLALIGLGLVFWGAVLLFIRPEGYVKTVLLEATLSPSIKTLYQAILELDYKGEATYLPPKYFANQEITKVYISKYKRSKLPTPETAQIIENQLMARTVLDILVTRAGVLITPPGIELSKMFEKLLSSSFAEIGLEKLLQDLPKLFIDSLEIAENLELREEYYMTEKKEDDSSFPTKMNRKNSRKKSNLILAKMSRPICGTMFKETEEPSQIASSIGCPVCSALAVAITQASGKPVRIIDIKRSEDGNTMEANYEILEK